MRVKLFGLVILLLAASSAQALLRYGAGGEVQTCLRCASRSPAREAALYARLAAQRARTAGYSPEECQTIEALADVYSHKASEPAIERQSAAPFVIDDSPQERHTPNILSDDALQPLIAQAAREFAVEPTLIRAVIEKESRRDANFVSGCGAQGLMQLMPDTAKDYDLEKPFDPLQNVRAGTHLLGDLLNRFKGDRTLALAAYNAGPGAVEKYKGVPPFQETQEYVIAVMTRYKELSETSH